MKNLMRSLAMTLLFSIGSSAFAEDEFTGGISVSQPFGVQVQMCSLKPGATISQYNKMLDGFFAWSEENNFNVTFMRQSPLFTHSNASHPSQYEFVEFIAAAHSVQGASWDKWLSTKEGQKLNARWNELATCHVKMANMIMQYANVDAMNSDSDRVVTWNWCTRKDGVSWDQLQAKHQSIAANVTSETPNIGWGTLFPHIGGANTPGEFAHVVIYPDVAGLMQASANFANGGWRGRDDYYTSYADCTGESANVEQVLHRPSM